MTFETVEQELQRQISALYGADPTTIQVVSDRLRQMAEQVEDELWRKRAIQRAEQLPALVAGSRGGSKEAPGRALCTRLRYGGPE